MPALALILRHWKLALTGLALAILASTAAYYRIDRDHWKRVATVLRIDLDNIKQATKLADEKARLAKAKAEQDYREKAERTDREYQAELADARSRAQRYADAHRVRPQAAGSQSGGPITAANGSGAQGADGPDQDAVILSRPDFDALNENTIRLKAAREWACGLEGAKCE